MTVRAYLGRRPSTYTYDHLGQLTPWLWLRHGDPQAAARAGATRQGQLPKRSIDTLISFQG